MKEQKKEESSFAKILIFIIIAFIVIIVAARYTTDEEYRSFINTNILKKEVSYSSLNYIELNSDSSPSVFAFDKYIAVLSKNLLTEYDVNGKAVAELGVNVAVPLVDTNGKYMVIAEKDGQKLYLISGNSVLWSTSIDGNISRVSVNKNGYVSIIITNTIYKSIVVFYEPSGKETFRNYISDNYAVCTSISTDNKYIAIGEINYSGAVMKSIIKIVSVELAQKNPGESIINTYDSENGEIITNINYQDKNRAICMFTSYVQSVGIDSDERVYDFSNDDVFLDINLNNGVAIVEKQSSGLFSFEYEVKIKNIDIKTDRLYILNSDLPKSIIVSGNKIGLNLGNEVQIINSNGWMVKKYNSSKQIKNLILGDTIAGIVYKNRIEILDL